MNVISTVNFIRGGKSSIARLLAERLQTTILNFDTKRDSEFYNAVKTMNIPANTKVKREQDKIVIETSSQILEISSSSKMFICDFGGRFDERIAEFPSDLYIVPTMDDFESISETIKATKFILKYNPKAKIIHILNMAMCDGAKDREDFIKGYKLNMEQNMLFVPYMIMPYSRLLKKIVNLGVKSKKIINNHLAEYSYRQINSFVDELILLIKKEID